MFRSLLINIANTPIPPQPTLGDYVIVGPAEIDGDVRAGVYSILNKANLTLVSDRSVGSNNVSAGHTILWQTNNANVTCTTGSYNEKMHLNINSQMTQQTVRITATIMLPNGDIETVYKDVSCTYAPADYVINSLNDWLALKSSIDNGNEASTYSGATTGCANKRFRLGCDLTFDYSVTDYSVGRYNTSTRTGPYFGGVFDGADYCITINGTHPQNLSTDRPGGVFSFVWNARIINLNVAGSISCSAPLAGVIGANRLCQFERIFSCATVTSSNNACSGVIGACYATQGRSYDTEIIPNFASTFKDIAFVGSAVASKNVGGITWDCCKNATRIISIGRIESKNTSNPAKSCFTLDDGDRVIAAFFADSLFSKAKIYRGTEESRGCVQIQGSTQNATVENILNLNDNTTASNMSTIFKHHSATITTNNVFYTVESSVHNTTWIKINGTKKTFAEACASDLFGGNSNWIKGNVGTNIINNQYATNTDVLSAAKNESYYGGY